jgi:hypothetical protein
VAEAKGRVGALAEADARAWRGVAEGGPFRLCRWLAIVGLVIGRWVWDGTPGSLVAWVPVFVLAGALLLPDTASFSVGGFSWRAARREADRAAEEREAAGEEHAAAKRERAAAEAVVQRIELVFMGAQPAGVAGGVAGLAREAGLKPAAEAMGEFLGPDAGPEAV